MGDDGIGDPSLYPDTIGVLDSTGKVVGTLETRLLHDPDDPDEIPVKNSSGEIVGHFGPNGYWALGEPKPESRFTVTVEEYDESDSEVPARIRVIGR